MMKVIASVSTVIVGLDASVVTIPPEVVWVVKA